LKKVEDKMAINLEQSEHTQIGAKKPRPEYALKYSGKGKGDLSRYYQMIRDLGQKLDSSGLVRLRVEGPHGILYFLGKGRKVIVSKTRRWSGAFFSGFDPRQYRGLSNILRGVEND